MDEERHTEAGGLEATWRPTHDQTGRIEIMNVHNTSGEVEVTFAPGTDLAAAREARPRWSQLWDQIRAEFWAGLLPAPRPSVTGNGMRWWH